jgi:hypothetical protein
MLTSQVQHFYHHYAYLQIGIMEWWNSGIMGLSNKESALLLLRYKTQPSILPVFQYSN